MTEENISLLAHQVKTLDDRLLEVSREMKTLILLNERQTAILEKVAGLDNRMADHEQRLREVEKYQPGLREARGWLVALISMACAAVVSLVITNATQKTKVIAFAPPAAVQQAPAPEQTSDGK